MNSVLHYLWRAVDQDNDEIDILVQKRKNKKAAIGCFEREVTEWSRIPLSLSLSIKYSFDHSIKFGR